MAGSDKKKWGKIEFTNMCDSLFLYHDRDDPLSLKQFQNITISRTEIYCRLTVPTMVWMGFQGRGVN